MAGDTTFPVVAGRRDLDGWKVWISAGGISVVLDPARARQLAGDIIDMCGVVEDGPPGVVTEVSVWSAPNAGGAA